MGMGEGTTLSCDDVIDMHVSAGFSAVDLLDSLFMDTHPILNCSLLGSVVYFFFFCFFKKQPYIPSRKAVYVVRACGKKN